MPPVTNDFMAMFKDTSVCSVITVMELTNQYSVQAQRYRGDARVGRTHGAVVSVDEYPVGSAGTVFERRARAAGPWANMIGEPSRPALVVRALVKRFRA